MNPKSLWSATTTLPHFPKLQGDIKTDVLVIGGGIAGILCAYFLDKAGVDYVLCEGDKITSGITKNTTAKITIQHGLIYHKLTKSLGTEMAGMYLKANKDALKTYEAMCRSMKCHFETKDSYIYSVDSREKIEKETKAMEKLGFDAKFLKRCELPFKIKGAIMTPDQAQFNPLEFISKISKDLKIYENTFIRHISPGTAAYDGGKIQAEKIIVATHFPFINRHGSYFLKMYQHRSYVAAYDGIAPFEGMYVDEDLKGLSFRSYDGLTLVGGGSHRTGKQGGSWNDIEKYVSHHHPDAKMKFKWAAQDCMTLDSIPYIGKYSKNTPNMFVLTGFNKWGFTSAMAGAKIIADLVQEKENEYAKVFSPQRSIIKPQLFVNGFESAINLVSPSVKRCPHLGCALKWNKAEHTWDCPCHGSRFEKNGTLIDNPATGDLKNNKVDYS